MSSTIGVPLITTDGPVPRAPLHNLLSVATEAPANDHWRAGSNLYPYPSGNPDGHDPCADGTFRVKPEPTATEIPEPFPAFTALLGEICSSFSVHAEWEEWKQRADLALAARAAWVAERQLATADFADGPHLGDDNVTVLLSGAATASEIALAALEDTIAASGIEGVIHLTPGVAADLGNDRLTERGAGGILRTARGTPVVIGSGYFDADPPTPGGTPEAAAAFGEGWIYASGPVVYRRGEALFQLPQSIADALGRDDNTVIYRAELDLWVAFDPVIQAAVLADWS